ncbi:MAG TPA: hypothetical protein VF593_01050, partial [Chthoniobacteraceae bacterium]
MSRWPTAVLAGFLLVSAAVAGSPTEDWAAVTALDAGPQGQPRTMADARLAANRHLDQQERALRSFLASHPQDAKAFEASLRLARLLEIRAGFQDS